MGLKQQRQAETHLNSLIGDALQQKEGLISELEKELAVEKHRREELNRRFDEQMKDIKSDYQKLEQVKQLGKQLQNERKDELDTVPTRQAPMRSKSRGKSASKKTPKSARKSAKSPAARLQHVNN